MNILIITQKIDKNDDVLGFFHDWVGEFANQYEKVSVICLEKREFSLPQNVTVFSLGKDQLKNKYKKLKILKKLIYTFNFYKLIWQLRCEYDLVFVHMIPLYANFGAPVWRMLGKKTSLWYAHGHVSLALRIAEKLVDVIVTSTPEGCRLPSEKVKIVGQGIDVEKFSQPSKSSKTKIKNNDIQENGIELKNIAQDKANFNDSVRDKSQINDAVRSKFIFTEVARDRGLFEIISIGRIAPVKDYETLIRALELVVKKYKQKKVYLKIIGAALLDDHEHYFRKLKRLVQEKGLEKYVEFTGSVPFVKITKHIATANLMTSASRTGSMDKVMLEAMSFGLPVITCNVAMKEILQKHKETLMFNVGNYKKLAELIVDFINMKSEDRKKIGKKLRAEVVKNHSLKSLVKKIKKCVE